MDDELNTGWGKALGTERHQTLGRDTSPVIDVVGQKMEIRAMLGDPRAHTVLCVVPAGYDGAALAEVAEALLLAAASFWVGVSGGKSDGPQEADIAALNAFAMCLASARQRISALQEAPTN